MIRNVLCSSDIFLHDVPVFDLNLLHTFNTHPRFLRCSPYADTKFNTGSYRKCEIRNRKLAGPSLFWHMQEQPPPPPPPTPCMGICQSVSGAQLQQGMWRISPPLCPPLHLHPPTLPQRGPNHGISLNNMVYVCNRGSRSHACQCCPLVLFQSAWRKERAN